jgi:hypothetical protein
MSAIGMPGPQRPFVISACGYEHSQLFFERQQSLELRRRAWEGRLKPLTSWSTLLVRGAGVCVLFGAAAAMLLH